MTYFGGAKVPFSEAFPEIEEMDIEITLSGGLHPNSPKSVQSYSLSSPPPPTTSCKGKCDGGKHNIERLIQKAVLSGGGGVNEGTMCHGQERMGKNQFRSCTGGCRITGTIKLKEKTQPSPPEAEEN